MLGASGILQKMKRDLDKLIEFVGRHFVFDEQIYPELKGANEEKRLAFAVRHSALHFSKTAGKVAAVSEDVDHGGELDIETVKENIPKAIISTLKLAEIVGMKGDEIVNAIEKKYKNNIDE